MTAHQEETAMQVTGYIPRILIAKAGLDGHDRGAKVIARALRDAGMEVVYTGLRASVPVIAATAVQESVDAIGLSVLSGAHLSICQALREELESRGAPDLPLVMGGIIPASDAPLLAQLGVRKVFGPETPTQEIVDFFRWLIEPKAWMRGGTAGELPYKGV